MDSDDELVGSTVYRAQGIVPYGFSGGQRAGEQEEMVGMFITAWTEV
jgi:hypothetical protein